MARGAKYRKNRRAKEIRLTQKTLRQKNSRNLGYTAFRLPPSIQITPIDRPFWPFGLAYLLCNISFLISLIAYIIEENGVALVFLLLAIGCLAITLRLAKRTNLRETFINETAIYE